MSYLKASEKILSEIIDRNGGKIRSNTASSVIKRRLKVKEELAVYLIKLLIKQGYLIFKEGYLIKKPAPVQCSCGARMYPPLLEKTKGFCPKCHHLIRFYYEACPAT